jgi:hypothetical protein
MPTLDYASFCVRAAILLAFLGVACGRTGLDAPVDVTISGSGGTRTAGAAGTTGTAGTTGFAGSTGFAGAGGFAGTGFAGFAGTTGVAGSGFAGFAGTTGVGGTTGVAGASGIGGTGGPVCTEGATTCFTDQVAETCQNGSWNLDFCPHACMNGACVDCKDGTTRCGSGPTVQFCKGGQWIDFTDCPFACVDGSCGMNPKKVFVTSQTFVGGELGGLDGADEICTKLAIAGGVPGTFRAWLSDSTGSPVTRFSREGGPYVLLSGDVVADNWNELTLGVAQVPIEITEQHDTPPGATGGCPGPAVWSNTAPTGAIVNADLSCGDWSDPMGRGSVWGSATSRDNWSDDCSNFDVDPALACGSRAALFCFEQ